MVDLARRPVVAAVSFCVVLLSAAILLIDSRNSPRRSRISNVALSKSGRWLAAGTADGKISIWDQTQPQSPKQIVFSHGSLNDLRFSPDERLLAIAAEDLATYAAADPGAPRILRSDRQNYGSARFGQDGQTLLVITGAGVIETVDARTGEVHLKICCSTIYGEAGFSPDGQSIVNAGHWPGLWDAGSGQLIGRLTASREFATFRPIAFDTNRNLVLMGSQDGRVYVWDLKTRQRIVVSPAQQEYVDTLTVAKDGSVIYAGFGQTVKLWNPETGERRSLTAARPTSNLVLSPDGASVLFGTAEGSVETWSLTNGRQLRSLKIPAS